MDLDKIKKEYDKLYGKKQKYLKNYYDDDVNTVPIYSRKPLSDLKSKYHTNLHINFANMIIDFKTGYMGRDISVSINPEGYGEEEYGRVARAISDFEFQNNMPAKNTESLTLSSVSGLSHRLLYIKNGQLRVKNIEAHKVVYDWDDDLYAPYKAYYYYSVKNIEGKEEERCDVYDSENIKHMVKRYINKKSWSWEERQVEVVDADGQIRLSAVEPHLLGEVPIFPIENNKDWKGDFEGAIKTIDRYDEVLSDLISEIKSIRGNYVVIQGSIYTPTDQATGEKVPVQRYLKERNLIVMPLDADGKPQGDVKILDINVPDEAVQNTLKGLREHIFEESKSIDIKRITQTQDARVFTIKTSLMPVENNCSNTENYFKLALYKQYRILSFYLFNSGQSSFDPRDVRFTFNRSFPTDEQAKAQTLSVLMNYMSAEDAYRAAGYERPKELAEKYAESLVEVDYTPDNIVRE